MKVSVLLSLGALLGTSSASSPLVLRADDVLHKSYASVLTRDVLPTAEGLSSESAPLSPHAPPPPPSALLRRQDAGGSAGGAAANSTASGLNATEPGIVLNGDGSLNFTAWSEAINPACVQSLAKLRRSTNPSGSCVCYNILALDMERGAFEADLRLFEISDPRDAFVGLRGDEIRVFADYDGAMAEGTDLTGEASALAGMPSGGRPRLNQVHRIKGQIDQAKLDEDMSLAALEMVLMPAITLRSVLATNTTTSVSLNEASFLAGVFSATSVMSDFGHAQLAVDDAMAALANGTAAFVLPGVQIMVFPVGLVISGTWLLVGLTAYGFGTFERMRYRDLYRSRVGRKGASNTI